MPIDGLPYEAGSTVAIPIGGDHASLVAALEAIEALTVAYGCRVTDLAIQDGGFVFQVSIPPQAATADAAPGT